MGSHLLEVLELKVREIDFWKLFIRYRDSSSGIGTLHNFFKKG
jgi:hypothetical protein